MKNNLKQIGIIIVISLFFSIIRYFFIQGDFDLVKKNKISGELIEVVDDSKNTLDDLISNLTNPTIIDLSVAVKVYDNNLATFIDARSIESFLDGHIKGAINIPFDDVENIEKQCDIIFMNEIGEDYVCKLEVEEEDVFIGMKNGFKFIKNDYDEKKEVNVSETIFVIYCSGEGCSLSEDLAFYMFDLLGFKKILVYEGGIAEWINNKLPIK